MRDDFGDVVELWLLLQLDEYVDVGFQEIRGIRKGEYGRRKAGYLLGILAFLFGDVWKDYIHFWRAWRSINSD